MPNPEPTPKVIGHIFRLNKRREKTQPTVRPEGNLYYRGKQSRELTSEHLNTGVGQASVPLHS